MVRHSEIIFHISILFCYYLRVKLRFCLTCVALERDGRQGRAQAPVVASPGRLSGRAVDIVRRSGANKRDSVIVIESRGDWVGPGRCN